MSTPSFLNFGVLPVLVVEDADSAAPLAHALVKGGLPVAEVTLRTKAAPSVIRQMADIGGLRVGAGTVLTKEHAKIAMDNGASFLVSPGLDIDVVKYAQDAGTIITPGVATASEVQAAIKTGLKLLKFFPASIVGGPGALKAYASVFADIGFVPTGGISLDNMGDYLSLPNVPSVGGSWLAPKALVSEGRFDEITQKTAEALSAAQKYKEIK